MFTYNEDFEKYQDGRLIYIRLVNADFAHPGADENYVRGKENKLISGKIWKPKKSSDASFEIKRRCDTDVKCFIFEVDKEDPEYSELKTIEINNRMVRVLDYSSQYDLNRLETIIF